MKHVHFSDITEQNAFLGIAEPEHPLLSVASFHSNINNDMTSCADNDFTISSDFYSISLKNIISGEIFYGRTQYDCKKGTMIFTAPKQEISTKGVKVESEGKSICFHEDFIRGHTIQQRIKKYNFFNYSVNEALHLSPREERLIATVFNNIEHEYHNNQDEFSKEIILSQLDTLLRYADRFYRRQFLHRQESQTLTKDKFIDALNKHVGITEHTNGIPSIETIAQQLHMTPRYLSDALKVETGKTAIENLHLFLIDKSKNLLLESNATIATVAYSLGFEYPQYFARLFKRKVGLTPTEYRKQSH